MEGKTDCGFVLLQDGTTALMFASQEGNGEVVQMLLDALPCVNKDAAETVGSRGASQAHYLRAVVLVHVGWDTDDGFVLL